MSKSELIKGILLIAVSAIIGLTVYLNSPVGKVEMKKWQSHGKV